MDRRKLQIPNSSSASAELGREVRRRRTDRKLTLEELGERSGLSGNFIGTVENGLRDPSLSTLMALAHGLDVQVRELLPGPANLSPEVMKAAEAFERAPPMVREGLLLVLRYHTEHPHAR